MAVSARDLQRMRCDACGWSGRRTYRPEDEPRADGSTGFGACPSCGGPVVRGGRPRQGPKRLAKARAQLEAFGVPRVE